MQTRWLPSASCTKAAPKLGLSRFRCPCTKPVSMKTGLIETGFRGCAETGFTIARTGFAHHIQTGFPACKTAFPTCKTGLCFSSNRLSNLNGGSSPVFETRRGGSQMLAIRICDRHIFDAYSASSRLLHTISCRF